MVDLLVNLETDESVLLYCILFHKGDWIDVKDEMGQWVHGHVVGAQDASSHVSTKFNNLWWCLLLFFCYFLWIWVSFAVEKVCRFCTHLYYLFSTDSRMHASLSLSRLSLSSYVEEQYSNMCRPSNLCDVQS